MSKYIEKPIDINKLLTINFQGATVPLVGSGSNLGLDNVLNKDIHNILKEHPFWGSGIRYKYEWEEIMKDRALKYRKYHTITINSDPSKLNWSPELKDQRERLFDVISYYQNKIKYLALVYEYGRGKLHWHILINIQSIKELEEDLQKAFGKGPAVVVKKVIPNSNESLQDNVQRILSYFRKEEHNKHRCLLYKY